MSAVPATFQRDDCRALQMLINEKTGLRLFPDGDIGPKTVSGLKMLQTKCNLPSTGVYDDKLDAVVGLQLRSKYLQDEHVAEAANALGVDKASVRAVLEVEAAGDGFLPDGRCDILFERHKFYQGIAKKYGESKAREIQSLHPTICHPEAGGYKGNEAEYARLAVAEAIDAEVAMDSTSWGLFQIMGFNAEACGYPNAVAFAEAMKKSERAQLLAFVAFIKKNPTLHAALKARDWTTFAKHYNGPAYWKNKYDTRLATAYAKHK